MHETPRQRFKVGQALLSLLFKPVLVYDAQRNTRPPNLCLSSAPTLLSNSSLACTWPFD